MCTSYNLYAAGSGRLRSGRVRLGEAGPVHHGYRLKGYKDTFLFINPIENKNSSFWDIALFWNVPYGCGKKVSIASSLRFASRRSQ